MLTCPALQDSLSDHIKGLLGGYTEGGACVLTVPWTDSLGEPLRVVVSQSENSAKVDDDGDIFFATGRMQLSSELEQQTLEQFIEDFLSMHGLTWNKEDQVAEMQIGTEHLTDMLLYFAQIVGACIAALPFIAKRSEEKESDARSLGPRLATKLSRQVEAWVKEYPGIHRRNILRRIKRKHPIEGLANPKWMVDFFYEPLLRIPTQPQEPPVVLITADLGVKEPLFKAEHAVTMSRDISLKGRGYTVRLAFAGDGRNGGSHTAREVIRILSKDTYQYYDLDDPEISRKFNNLLRSEVVGEPWL